MVNVAIAIATLILVSSALVLGYAFGTVRVRGLLLHISRLQAENQDLRVHPQTLIFTEAYAAKELRSTLLLLMQDMVTLKCDLYAKARKVNTLLAEKERDHNLSDEWRAEL